MGPCNERDRPFAPARDADRDRPRPCRPVAVRGGTTTSGPECGVAPPRFKEAPERRGRLVPPAAGDRRNPRPRWWKLFGDAGTETARGPTGRGVENQNVRRRARRRVCTRRGTGARGSASARALFPSLGWKGQRPRRSGGGASLEHRQTACRSACGARSWEPGDLWGARLRRGVEGAPGQCPGERGQTSREARAVRRKGRGSRPTLRAARPRCADRG